MRLRVNISHSATWVTDDSVSSLSLLLLSQPNTSFFLSSISFLFNVLFSAWKVGVGIGAIVIILVQEPPLTLRRNCSLLSGIRGGKKSDGRKMLTIQHACVNCHGYGIQTTQSLAHSFPSIIRYVASWSWHVLRPSMTS